jgi:Zn-dependent M28 family amino/carboxypeptidase
MTNNKGDRTMDITIVGPGLNDNGSGMAGTLAIALNLARLLSQHEYAARIRSRLKFCWWGGEEAGLLGSIDYVRRAKGDGSLKNYLINLNFDMIGSPNFIFGIYDGKTADNQTTPKRALPGSNRITGLFVDYFDRQRLPWDYTEFSGRSDYGPFLAEGIACGGLFAGGDDVKTQEQRDRYSKMLGSSLGGIANADLDPCYHRKCDTLENLNLFAYLHMVKAAAHVIDYLAQLHDLNQWLYPTS